MFCVVSQVLDVPQDMALPVLTDEIPQICSQTHVCDGRFVVPPLLHGKSFEEYESFAIEEFVAHGLEKTGETREVEVVLRTLSLCGFAIISLQTNL